MALCYVISVCDPEQQRFFTDYMRFVIIFAILNVQCFFAKENARKISDLMSVNVMVACYSASDCVPTANRCQYDFSSYYSKTFGRTLNLRANLYFLH